MLERCLSAREISDRETLIRILKETLPNLSDEERNAVIRAILRMKNEIEESDRRIKYGSRKADQKR